MGETTSDYLEFEFNFAGDRKLAVRSTIHRQGGDQGVILLCHPEVHRKVQKYLQRKVPGDLAAWGTIGLVGDGFIDVQFEEVTMTKKKLTRRDRALNEWLAKSDERIDSTGAPESDREAAKQQLRETLQRLEAIPRAERARKPKRAKKLSS